MRTRAHAQGRDAGTAASARAGVPGVGHCAAELPGPGGPEAAARMYRRQHHPGRRGARAGPWLPRAFQAGHRRAWQLPSGATGAARYRGLAGGQLRRLGTHGHAHRRRLRGARRRARCTCRAHAVHMPCTCSQATREYQSLRCFAPELVVLMLGTNDAKPVHQHVRRAVLVAAERAACGSSRGGGPRACARRPSGLWSQSYGTAWAPQYGPGAPPRRWRCRRRTHCVSSSQVHWGPRQSFPHARLVRALVGLGRQARQ
jgi:hypothetical protein